MSHLSLAFLGAPEIRHGGRILTFRTRKALALLVYLAVAGGLHSREKLTALYWPESDEPQGRTMLRTTIAHLRTALDDTPEHSHLTVERDTLGFRFTSDVDLDLRTLEAAFKLSQMAVREENIQGDARRTLLSQLSAAVDCYRGNFLDGFYLHDAPDFEDWTRLQCEVWHLRVCAVFDRLAQVQSEGGEVPNAIDSTTRWIAHDSLHEAAYRRLMQLHFAVGDRNAALQAYETCRAILAEQLRTQPAPETEALAERIRSTNRGVPAPLSPRTPSATLPPSFSPLMLPAVPLVGRASEFGKLVEVYHSAKHGQAQIVVLTGEAGIGKTRLANEFLGWVAAQGVDALQGRAFEMGGPLPYQPLVEALRSRIERENAPDDLLSDTWLAELSRLLPELRDRYPDLPAPTADETTARIRLFEAVARLLQALACRGGSGAELGRDPRGRPCMPIVLFFDDMQWADAASLDVLHYAGQHWAKSRIPILLLLSMRTEALASPNALTKWLSSLKHDLHVTSLALGSLTLADTVQLISALGASGGATAKTARARTLEDVGEWLFSETRGQPFYIIETLKALLERGMLALHLVEAPHARTVGPALSRPSPIYRPNEAREASPARWSIDFDEAARNEARLHGLLPTGVREVIRARLDHLTTASSALLTAAAVLGQGFNFELLCEVATLGESDAFPALDEVLRHGLLREGTGEEAAEHRTSPGMYFFTHDKIRDVIYTEMGEARRRIFHHRAFDALQDQQRPPAELAHHALAAGLSERAFHCSVAAGDDAMRLFAMRDAVAHYEQALRVLTKQWNLQSLPSILPVSMIEHLYLQLGRAYELSNEFEQARSVYQAMLAFSQQANTARMECAALNRQAVLAAEVYADIEGATSLLHQAVQVAEQSGEMSDPTGLAETEWNLAKLSLYRLDPASELARAEHALMLSRQLGMQELIARCLNVLSWARMELGRWQEAERDALEGRALCVELENRALEIDCLCEIAVARINLGQPHAAISAAREAHAISQEIEQAYGQANSAIHLAQALLEIGSYAEALTFAELAVNLAQTHRLTMLLTLGLITLGAVHRTMLALDTARAVHERFMAMAEYVWAELNPLLETVATELCTDCALAGSWEEAHAYALKALANRSDIFLSHSKLAFWWRTEALVRAGELERATEDVQHFGVSIGNSRRYRIPYLRSLAVLAQYRGKIDAAIGHLQEAAKLAEEIGLPGELWLIQAALGELFLIEGNGEQARHAFTQAALIVHKLVDALGNNEQRTNFLASPMVRRMLERCGSEDPGRVKAAQSDLEQRTI